MQLLIGALFLAAICTISLCSPALDVEEQLLEEELLEDIIARLETNIDKRQGKGQGKGQGLVKQESKNDAVKQEADQVSLVKPILPLINPCAQKCCPTGLAVADLESGKVSSNLPKNIEVAVDSASGDRKCSGSGKLKATFERITEEPCDVCMSEPFYGRRMLKLVLTLASGQGSRNKWMFGIGDSVSSNGYGGDSSTNHYDAEVDGFYPNINLYSNDACKESGDSARFMTTIANALAMGINEITMYIANGFVRVVSGDIDYRLCSDCLFGLNGQKDVLANGTDVTNYDIYMRFNGVVNGQSDRTGYGLCRVKASWVCARDDKY